MIEKEFRDLINKIEDERREYKDNNKLVNDIISILKDNLKKFYKDVYIDLSYNDYQKKSYDIDLYLEIKNKDYDLLVLEEIYMNAIINTLYLNIKSSYFDLSKQIIRDYDYNRLVLYFKNFSVCFKMYYKKDNLSNIPDAFNNQMILSSELEIENDYFKKLDKKFNKFNDTISVIMYYLNNNSIVNIRMIKYLLAYSLSTYESDNTIIGNLKAFTNGLNDLIDGKILKPTEEDYSSYNIKGNFINCSRFNLYTISKKSENLLLDNDKLVKDLKELKSSIMMSLPKDGKFISINVTPNYVERGKTIEWSFQIEDTDIANHGGEYEYTTDNYYMCCYKAMLKGLQFVVKNKLSQNVVIKCNTLDPFRNGSLSYENESRFANVLQFIKENDLMIDYKEI